MKHKILFSLVMVASITTYAQTEKKTTGYAITANQWGQPNWKSVRLVDLTTGEELRSVYSTDMQEPELLNARTGKPVVKKTNTQNERADVTVVMTGRQSGDASKEYTINRSGEKIVITADNIATTDAISRPAKLKTDTVRIVRGYRTVIINRQRNENENGNTPFGHRFYFRESEPETDAPFATGSTALAYDKKHDRLYYTPMGINQLRYIDLKSKTPKIYYFEDEAFGTTTGRWDVGNQITRMVIASDGNGYALSNNNQHLLRFTTGKNPEIRDLGALADDAANDQFTVTNAGRSGSGGDLIADASENLYLITGGRQVFKIAINSKLATYQGTIEGLPYGFSTNGAMVEEGSKVIVGSSQSAEGYYRVDLSNLQAEKISTNGPVFRVADLASGNLLFDKKERKEEIMPVLAYQSKAITEAVATPGGIAIYPNPVFGNTVKLSFTDQPAGDYQIQLMELSGKVISSRDVIVNSKVQQVVFNLPQSLPKGSYLVKTISVANKVSVLNKLVVE